MSKYHDKGQKDAAKGFGNHNRPHGEVSRACALMFEGKKAYDKETRENREYDAGYRNGVKQRR